MGYMMRFQKELGCIYTLRRNHLGQKKKISKLQKQKLV
jgi:hypothetical protein